MRNLSAVMRIILGTALDVRSPYNLVVIFETTRGSSWTARRLRTPAIEISQNAMGATM